MLKTITIIMLISVVGVGAYLIGENTNTPAQSHNQVITPENDKEEQQDVEDAQAMTQNDGQCPGFIITIPDAGDTVTFPLTINGIIHPDTNPGPWVVFEGEAGSVRVQDNNGSTISDIHLVSLNVPWMNSNPKPFSVTIPELTGTPYSNQINLVFRDNNVAGPGEGQTHQCVLDVQL